MLSLEVDIDIGPLEERFSDAALERAQMELTETVAASFQDGDYVPKRTGKLRDSVDVLDASQGAVIWTMEYAGYVFHGTMRQKAQNWLKRAVDADEDIKWAEAVGLSLNGGK